MKKARLKINFTNSLGTRLKDEILVFKNDRYQVNINDNFGITKEFVESNPDIFEVFEVKWLADEFQVLKLEPYLDEKPTSPKGKIFDDEKDAKEYHNSLQHKKVVSNNISKYLSKEELTHLWEEHKELTHAMQYTKGEDNIRVKERLEKLDEILNINSSKNNVVEVEIPEGYEVESIHNTRCNEINNNRGTTHVNFIKQPIKSCKTCLFELHKDKCHENFRCRNYIDNSRILDNWQSKQDLSNTKIYIGDNPKLSKLVQKKAFELGWDWQWGSSKEVRYTEYISLFFYENKFIYHGSYGKEDFNNPNQIEITPQDLGIKEEDYKVILTTEDGVNLYIGDTFYAVGKNFNILLKSGKTEQYNFIVISTTKRSNFELYFSTKQAAEKYIFDKKVEELKQQYNQ